jgi:hypothetical protein
MNSLASQQAFAQALFDAARQEFEGIRCRGGIDPQRRFAVHRNNFVVTLADALADAFPVTQALIGKDFFRAMARERIRTSPPSSPILVDYGDGFAEFIDEFAPAAGVPYLADIARLEYARVCAYHAADAVPVAIDEYHTLLATPDRLTSIRLTLHPSCRWLHSEYAAHSIWAAHQGIDDLNDAELGAIAVDTPEDVLIARPGWDVKVTRLPCGGIAFLDALRDGLTLGAALARAEKLGAPQLESLLALIVQAGLAIELDFSSEYANER